MDVIEFIFWSLLVYYAIIGIALMCLKRKL